MFAVIMGCATGRTPTPDDRFEAALARAVFALEGGNPAGALETLSQLLALQPRGAGDYRIHALRGDAFGALGQFEGAAQSYEQALQCLDQGAIVTMSESLARRDRSWVGFEKLATRVKLDGARGNKHLEGPELIRAMKRRFEEEHPDSRPDSAGDSAPGRLHHE